MSDHIHDEARSGTLMWLASNLSESTGYANLELISALLGTDRRGWLQTIEKDGATIISQTAERSFLPLPASQSWITPLTSSGHPASSQNAALADWRALLSNLRNPHIYREIPLHSGAFAALKSVSTHFAILEEWQRAALKTDRTFDGWMKDNFDQKRRKELNRVRSRLSEQGRLVTERLTSTGLSDFIEDFLRLESGGWKGQAGSSLSQDPRMAAALRNGLQALHRVEKLRFWRILFNGVAIASLFAIVENGQATLGKIAYDEAYSKYSPGVLIILDATADFFADPAIFLADSNAIPDHPMINRIWRDRIGIANVMVAGHRTGALRFAATLTAEKLRLALRKQVKTLYHKIRTN